MTLFLKLSLDPIAFPCLFIHAGTKSLLIEFNYVPGLVLAAGDGASKERNGWNLCLQDVTSYMRRQSQK